MDAGKGDAGDVGRRAEAELAQQFALDPLDVQPDDVGVRQPVEHLAPRAHPSPAAAARSGTPPGTPGDVIAGSDVIVRGGVAGRVADNADGDEADDKAAAANYWRH